MGSQTHRIPGQRHVAPAPGDEERVDDGRRRTARDILILPEENGGPAFTREAPVNLPSERTRPELAFGSSLRASHNPGAL